MVDLHRCGTHRSHLFPLQGWYRFGWAPLENLAALQDMLHAALNVLPENSLGGFTVLAQRELEEQLVVVDHRLAAEALGQQVIAKGWRRLDAAGCCRPEGVLGSLQPAGRRVLSLPGSVRQSA